MEEPYSENVKFTPVQGLVDPIKTLKEVQDKALVLMSVTRNLRKFDDPIVFGASSSTRLSHFHFLLL